MSAQRYVRQATANVWSRMNSFAKKKKKILHFTPRTVVPTLICHSSWAILLPQKINKGSTQTAQCNSKVPFILIIFFSHFYFIAGYSFLLPSVRRRCPSPCGIFLTEATCQESIKSFTPEAYFWVPLVSFVLSSSRFTSWTDFRILAPWMRQNPLRKWNDAHLVVIIVEINHREGKWGLQSSFRRMKHVLNGSPNENMVARFLYRAHSLHLGMGLRHCGGLFELAPAELTRCGIVTHCFSVCKADANNLRRSNQHARSF